MLNLFKTLLGQLRIITFAEGMSYLILLFIAMPLKYWAGYPNAVRAFGTVHGVLFVLYVSYVLICSVRYRWSIGKAFVLLLVSVIPFGNFFADKYYLHDPAPIKA